MTAQEVYAIAKIVAPQFGLDPFLVLAISEQESAFDETSARLEEGFYLRYTKPMKLATTTEVLLASSYGLMQTMGESLSEMGYFTDTTPEGVCTAINQYMVSPSDQIRYGCKWFAGKLRAAGGDTVKALRFWNGDIDGKRGYAESVLAKKAILQSSFT